MSFCNILTGTVLTAALLHFTVSSRPGLLRTEYVRCSSGGSCRNSVASAAMLGLLLSSSLSSKLHLASQLSPSLLLLVAHVPSSALRPLPSPPAALPLQASETALVTNTGGSGPDDSSKDAWIEGTCASEVMPGPWQSHRCNVDPRQHGTGSCAQAVDGGRGGTMRHPETRPSRRRAGRR